MRFAFVLAFALAMTGCSDELAHHEAAFVESDLSGSVRIPLLTAGTDGTVYRLRGATFEISGSAMVTLAERDGASAEELVTPLPPGDYSVFLRPGWEIVAIKADGTVAPAPAHMMGKNPVHLVVGQMSDSSLELQFRSDDRELSFGSSSPVRVTSASL